MAVGLAIAIERFSSARPRSENRKLWATMLPVLQGGRSRRSSAASEATDAAIGKIVVNGLERMQSPCAARTSTTRWRKGMMEIVPRLEKRTHYIATLANVITLVGPGHHHRPDQGFTAVAAVNPAEKAELLSASISIAMNNTAFALSVAIPLLIHAFLQARTTEIVDGLEAAKISFLNVTGRIKAEQQAGHAHWSRRALTMPVRRPRKPSPTWR